MRRSDIGACLVLGSCLVLGAGPIAPQVVPINETRALRPDASVELAVVAHALVVEGWDRSEIQITGAYDSEYESVDVGGSEQSFHFRIEQDRNERGRREDSPEVTVRLPRGVSLDAATVSGSLRASGLSGSISGRVVSGGVDVEGDLSSAELHSVSGSVTYRGDAPSVRLESVSGSVEYEGDAESLELKAVSGSVRVMGRAEAIEATSVSGSVSISSAIAVSTLLAESVSGSVSYSGELASGGTIDVKSHSGTVDLVLPNVDARFHLSTFSGRIDTALPEIRDEARSQGRFTPNQSLRFMTGSGSGRVTAASFSGSVRIRAEAG